MNKQEHAFLDEKIEKKKAAEGGEKRTLPRRGKDGQETLKFTLQVLRKMTDDEEQYMCDGCEESGCLDFIVFTQRGMLWTVMCGKCRKETNEAKQTWQEKR